MVIVRKTIKGDTLRGQNGLEQNKQKNYDKNSFGTEKIAADSTKFIEIREFKG